MKVTIENEKYDVILAPTEWRYSAAIVGLLYYFEFHDVKHEKIEYEISTYEGWPCIKYSSGSISRERYLAFAENFYADEFAHLKAEHMLQKDEWIDDQIKNINDFLTGNTVLKKIFNKNKFDGTNQNHVLQLMNENREEIIQESFRYKLNLYRKFCNTNLLFTKQNPHCRLLGYIVDENRKSRETSFVFDFNKVSTTDIEEFDFIPFAFTNTSQGFFVNNNYNIEMLFKTAKKLKEVLEQDKQEKETAKMTLLRNLTESSQFLDYDVEVIIKNQDKDYFETLFLRKDARLAMGKIKNIKQYNFRYELGKDYWLNVEEELFDRCVNQVVLDDLIELLLKIRMKDNIEYLDFMVSNLVDLNVEWKEDFMNSRGEIRDRIDEARKAGFLTAIALRDKKAENKITSYRQKLTSAVVFHDYDRVNEILLQLEGYAGMDYSFVYDLFEDGEKNKDIVFAFISALNPNARRKDD